MLDLTTCPDQCFSVVSPHLGSLGHSLVCVKIEVKAKESSDIIFHWTVFNTRNLTGIVLDYFIAETTLNLKRK